MRVSLSRDSLPILTAQAETKAMPLNSTCSIQGWLNRFFFLDVVEIVVRNAVDQTLARIAGTSDWHKERDFIDKTFSSRSNEALQ